jgi:uncharacterized protein YerC
MTQGEAAMGEWREITNPKTLEKVKKVRELLKNGHSYEKIAEIMKLSVSRIKELEKGMNWVSGA